MKKALIYYRSNWEQAFIHLPVDEIWTSVPMKIDLNHYGFHEIQIDIPDEGREFVVTDGVVWDNPAPWNKRTRGNNYFL
jgi:hypothetical protein